MRSISRWFVTLFLAVALAGPMVAMSGCGNRIEDPQYVQWEHETHRPHQDLNKRSDADKREYDEWRRNHQH
jgi:hypothetical protein